MPINNLFAVQPAMAFGAMGSGARYDAITPTSPDQNMGCRISDPTNLGGGGGGATDLARLQAPLQAIVSGLGQSGLGISQISVRNGGISVEVILPMERVESNLRATLPNDHVTEFMDYVRQGGSISIGLPQAPLPPVALVSSGIALITEAPKEPATLTIASTVKPADALYESNAISERFIENEHVLASYLYMTDGNRSLTSRILGQRDHFVTLKLKCSSEESPLYFFAANPRGPGRHHGDKISTAKRCLSDLGPYLKKQWQASPPPWDGDLFKLVMTPVEVPPGVKIPMLPLIDLVTHIESNGSIMPPHKRLVHGAGFKKAVLKLKELTEL